MVDWELVHDDFQEWKQQRDLDEEAAKRERQRQPFKETYFPDDDLQLTFENYFGPDQEDIAFPFHHYLNDKTGAFGGVNIYPGLMGLRRDVQGNWQRRSHGEISRERAEELFENEYKPFWEELFSIVRDEQWEKLNDLTLPDEMKSKQAVLKFLMLVDPSKFVQLYDDSVLKLCTMLGIDEPVNKFRGSQRAAENIKRKGYSGSEFEAFNRFLWQRLFDEPDPSIDKVFDELDDAYWFFNVAHDLISELSVDWPAPQIAVTLPTTRNLLRINFGNWFLFDYQNKGGNTFVTLTLAEEDWVDEYEHEAMYEAFKHEIQGEKLKPYTFLKDDLEEYLDTREFREHLDRSLNLLDSKFSSYKRARVANKDVETLKRAMFHPKQKFDIIREEGETNVSLPSVDDEEASEYDELLETLQDFIDQSHEVNFKYKHFNTEFKGLQTTAGFGEYGNKADVTHFDILGPSQKVSDGIYICFLYDYANSKLMLTYGVSERNDSSYTWPQSVTDNHTKIKESDRATDNLHKYGESYIINEYPPSDLPTRSNKILTRQ